MITTRADKSGNSEIVLKEQMHQLLVQYSELSERFTKSQSWKNKLLDYVVGAAVGAAFSIALQIFFK